MTRLHNEKKVIDEAAFDAVRWMSPAERAEEARRKTEPRVRFGEYGVLWIDERRSSKGEPLRALTQKDYRQVLATYFVPTFGRNQPIDQITRADVRAWHASLNKTTPRFRIKAYGLLRAIMNTAVDDELVAASPVHILSAGGATSKRPVEPATPAELKIMAANMPPRLRAAILISAWCALRYGELAELRRKDVDVANHQIKIRRTVTFPPGGAVVGRRSQMPASGRFCSAPRLADRGGTSQDLRQTRTKLPALPR